ncbi:hypothetical protein GWI33_013136, partial [Rhynchophorus ferrugineus]
MFRAHLCHYPDLVSVPKAPGNPFTTDRHKRRRKRNTGSRQRIRTRHGSQDNRGRMETRRVMR